jgi:hypothetical protein
MPKNGSSRYETRVSLPLRYHSRRYSNEQPIEALGAQIGVRRRAFGVPSSSQIIGEWPGGALLLPPG